MPSYTGMFANLITPFDGVTDTSSLVTNPYVLPSTLVVNRVPLARVALIADEEFNVTSTYATGARHERGVYPNFFA